MSNYYVTRHQLRDAIGLPASATGDNDQLGMTLEDVSRLIDDYLGYHVYAAVETRYFKPRETMRLHLDRPLLAVTALRTDSSGNASYGTTMATTQYDLAPDNATSESPPRPFWDIELRASSTGVFPAGVRRGVELVGTWGLFDQRATSTATLATDIGTTATTFEVNGATALHPGHTIRLGGEDMFVLRSPVTATAGTASNIVVERARNGSTAATHSSATGIQVYQYPLVDRAALYQAQEDFRRGLADPSAGGAGFGESGRLAGNADLHPAVRRMLNRVPVVG